MTEIKCSICKEKYILEDLDTITVEELEEYGNETFICDTCFWKAEKKNYCDYNCDDCDNSINEGCFGDD